MYLCRQRRRRRLVVHRWDRHCHIVPTYQQRITSLYRLVLDMIVFRQAQQVVNQHVPKPQVNFDSFRLVLHTAPSFPQHQHKPSE
jgi:hypothetical protein